MTQLNQELAGLREQLRQERKRVETEYLSRPELMAAVAERDAARSDLAAASAAALTELRRTEEYRVLEQKEMDARQRVDRLKEEGAWSNAVAAAAIEAMEASTAVAQARAKALDASADVVSARQRSVAASRAVIEAQAKARGAASTDPGLRDLLAQAKQKERELGQAQRMFRAEAARQAIEAEMAAARVERDRNRWNDSGDGWNWRRNRSRQQDWPDNLQGGSTRRIWR